MSTFPRGAYRIISIGTECRRDIGPRQCPCSNGTGGFMCTHCVAASKYTFVAAAACLLTAVCRIFDTICHAILDKVEDAACGPGSSCDRTMLMDNYDRPKAPKPPSKSISITAVSARRFSCSFSDALKRSPTYKLFWSGARLSQSRNSVPLYMNYAS